MTFKSTKCSLQCQLVTCSMKKNKSIYTFPPKMLTNLKNDSVLFPIPMLTSHNEWYQTFTDIK